MAGLVLELQRETLNSSVPVTDLLRKALVVAKKLEVQEFEKWILLELEGYSKGEQIPEYRIVRGEVRVWNPYYGWQPLGFSKPGQAQKISTRTIGQPISGLESIARGQEKDSILYIDFPKEVESQLMNGMDVPLRPTLHVSDVHVHGIIDAVRNVVLKWSMKLEEDGILGEGLSFSLRERELASEASYNVVNFYGPVGQSQLQQGTLQSTQTLVIEKVDTKILREFIEKTKRSLENLGLGTPEKEELRAEISTLEAQASSPKPKILIVRESLLSLRRILEGAAGSAAANLLLEVGKLLS